jgi:hypothetical protein
MIRLFFKINYNQELTLSNKYAFLGIFHLHNIPRIPTKKHFHFNFGTYKTIQSTRRNDSQPLEEKSKR